MAKAVVQGRRLWEEWQQLENRVERSLTAVRITRGDPDSVSGLNTCKATCNQLRAMYKIQAKSNNRDDVPLCSWPYLTTQRFTDGLWWCELLQHHWLLLLLQ